ncbi:MAG: Rrf2 family transcriptional regulator [Actinomycetota bacterium]
MRLEITRKTDLAIRAIIELSSEDGPVRAAKLAEAIGATPQFAPQVMAPLVRAGWVVSYPGPKGGHELVADLDALSVLDVVEAVEGATVDGQCVLQGTPCPTTEFCALHHAWVEARELLLGKLSATSLADVMSDLPYGDTIADG